MHYRYCFLFVLAMSASAHAVDLQGLEGGLLKNLKEGVAPGSGSTSPSASRSGVESLSDTDVVKGLKEALNQGAATAVAQLGKPNGFLDNEKVKIPLPPALQDVASVMRAMGQGRTADELVVTMNHAAEKAVPQAKTLLLDAIEKMSVQDAKNILTGGDDAATQYFRRATESRLHDRFLPIVSEVVGKLGVTAAYNNFAGKAAQFGLVDRKQASVQEYVTQKALDGLFVMMADEERAIREHPLERSGYWVKKVFGALGR